eukprot:TRINITY_DN5396_c2_g1_i1.p1 TRINITY_DN5396_c2_g1~~TRINITY_DN5396_c2_g1_i1.p1  ORF type:complete len:1591 (+),score=556.61 TRINITY_DN5396_c2_g1_i1:464-4774(+)
MLSCGTPRLPREARRRHQSRKRRWARTHEPQPGLSPAAVSQRPQRAPRTSLPKAAIQSPPSPRAQRPSLTSPRPSTPAVTLPAPEGPPEVLGRKGSLSQYYRQKIAEIEVEGPTSPRGKRSGHGRPAEGLRVLLPPEAVIRSPEPDRSLAGTGLSASPELGDSRGLASPQYSASLSASVGPSASLAAAERRRDSMMSAGSDEQVSESSAGSGDHQQKTVHDLLAERIRRGQQRASDILQRYDSVETLSRAGSSAAAQDELAMSLDRLRREIEKQEDVVTKKGENERVARLLEGKMDGAAIAAAEAESHQNEQFVPEDLTGMPVSDVHNYLLYCQMHQLGVVLRPVADGAAQAFIGRCDITDPTLRDSNGYPILTRTDLMPWAHLRQVTRHVSNARGKTMATALKSSPYEPIKGTVPLNAQLSKVGAQQTQMKSDLETALIEAEQRSGLREQQAAEGAAEADSLGLSASGGDASPTEGSLSGSRSPRSAAPSSPGSRTWGKTRASMLGGRIKMPKQGKAGLAASVSIKGPPGSPAGKGGTRRGSLTAVYAQLKSMESSAARMLDKIEEDSKRAMLASAQKLQQLLQKYNNESMHSLDKRKVAEMYVDEFNQSQFLGQCFARYGPQQEKIHFLVNRREQGVDPRQWGMAYQEADAPVFVLVPAGDDARRGKFRKWDTDRKDFVEMPPPFPPEGTEPVAVKLVASRMFYISPETGRIEEREEGAMLVPDFDGLSYAKDRVLPKHLAIRLRGDALKRALVEYYEEIRSEQLNLTYRDNMGLVSGSDVEHIEEVRALTDWRQSHGEEANNTVKTQQFLPGNYSAFDSFGQVTVLRDFADCVQFFRRMWRMGCPLRLNPNWNVVLDVDWLPVAPNDSINPLYDREAREALVLEKLKASQEWDMPSLRCAYDRIFTRDVIEGWRGLPRTRDDKKPSEQGVEVWRAYVRFRDELKVTEHFFKIRQLLLDPPLVFHKGRQVQELSERERQELRLPSGAEVFYARYGFGSKWRDVTDIVRHRIRHNLEVSADPEHFLHAVDLPDPPPRASRLLLVEHTDRAGCIERHPPGEREAVTALLSVERHVRQELRMRLNQRVLDLVSDLNEQRRAFREKHGDSSTDFVDCIWDYMMVHELRFGFEGAEATSPLTPSSPQGAQGALSEDSESAFGSTRKRTQHQGDQPGEGAALNTTVRAGGAADLGGADGRLGATAAAGVVMVKEGAGEEYLTRGQRLAAETLKRAGNRWGTVANPFAAAPQPLLVSSRQAADAVTRELRVREEREALMARERAHLTTFAGQSDVEQKWMSGDWGWPGPVAEQESGPTPSAQRINRRRSSDTLGEVAAAFRRASAGGVSRRSSASSAGNPAAAAVAALLAAQQRRRASSESTQQQLDVTRAPSSRPSSVRTAHLKGQGAEAQPQPQPQLVLGAPPAARRRRASSQHARPAE